jgi:four helix bundle protein
MNEQTFKDRTKKFALRMMRFVETLPKTRTGSILGRQLLRSAISVGGNYRAACRANSPAHKIARLGAVVEECDKSLYWMELLAEAEIIPVARLSELMKESEELLSLAEASVKAVGTPKPRPNSKAKK